MTKYIEASIRSKDNAESTIQLVSYRGPVRSIVAEKSAPLNGTYPGVLY